ncbi:MAG: glutathione synthase [Proteobacteria bacterium]|jgi:glutathione synthase|nr:glutathione synthase [Pseudomonadales bacterium]MDA0804655.1 glutathione synthase [Pseudomonadota bacterium]MDA0895617.1 glutathione synthase [Pseudomonadota bacterium]MDA1244562.1 glutathione synthase [Pseudomonadota bacterium]MDP4782133.1 glutathione synthase [Gammaproteobacteria bacterium]
MTVKLGVVMDPIANINVKKDTTLAMLLAAQRRGWELYYMEQNNLSLDQGLARGEVRRLSVQDNPEGWYELGSPQDIALSELDVLLMRKDPPFDMDFIYSTYILEAAQRAGTLVVNDPRSLRDCNEKLFATQFPQCCPPLIVAASAARLKAFHAEHGDVIFKPLDGMGGASIFRVKAGDPNLSVIIETLTDHGRQQIMAQKFLPEIVAGDKRILLVDGEPAEYGLARIPMSGETRGNLAAGGSGVAMPLTDRERWICAQVAPVLREKGLLFVGLDVIGDYLTEINVTSPTCVRELDRAHELDIAGDLMNVIATKLAARG